MNKIDDIEAYIQALLDITNNKLPDAINIVCDDIQVKEHTDIKLQCGWYGSIQWGGNPFATPNYLIINKERKVNEET